MHSDEIERRLRMPAHDEPSFLPPLLLPQASGFDLTGSRVRAGSAGASLRLLSPRLVLALVALLAALAAATVTVRSASTGCRPVPDPALVHRRRGLDRLSRQLGPAHARGSRRPRGVHVADRGQPGRARLFVCRHSMGRGSVETRCPVCDTESGVEDHAGTGRVGSHHRRGPGARRADLQRRRGRDLRVYRRRPDGDR